MLRPDAADDVTLEPMGWERCRGGDSFQCRSQCGHVIVWHVKAAHSVLDRFGKTSVVGHDGRNAANYRFDRDQPERFGPSRRHHDGPGGSDLFFHTGGIAPAGEGDRARLIQTIGQSLQGRPQWPATDDPQAGVGNTLASNERRSIRGSVGSCRAGTRVSGALPCARP